MATAYDFDSRSVEISEKFAAQRFLFQGAFKDSSVLKRGS